MNIDQMVRDRPAADLSISETGPEKAQWLAERLGKLTASQMHRAMSFKKNGEPTQDRTNYQYEILAERLTQINVRHYVNPAMEWGILTEPEAKAAYTAMTGNPIHPSGFYDHPMIDMFGATPDGELGSDGLIEIKAPTTQTFLTWVMNGVVPDEHQPQMVAQCLCTGRKWVEFVAFDPRIKDEKRRLFILRYEPSDVMIHKVYTEAIKFLEEVDQMWEAFHAGATDAR